MALYPAGGSCIYKPIPGHNSGRRAAYYGFVPHCQVGHGSLYGYFSAPATQASTHFWFPQAQGQPFEQYLDTDLSSWGAMAANSYYTQGEAEGETAEPLTAWQIVCMGMVIRWERALLGAAAYPLSLVDHGQRGITPHCHPDGAPDPSWGGHSCPGPGPRLAQTPLILSAAAPLAPPAPSSAPVTPAPNPLLTKEYDNMVLVQHGTAGASGSGYAIIDGNTSVDIPTMADVAEWTAKLGPAVPISPAQFALFPVAK